MESIKKKQIMRTELHREKGENEIMKIKIKRKHKQIRNNSLYQKEAERAMKRKGLNKMDRKGLKIK